MRISRYLATTGSIVFLVLSLGARAGGQAPPMPKPGPEHEVLKLEQGVWNAVVEFSPEPGKPAAKSKGVETNTIACGGLCLVTDFKGELAPGMAFEGHGIATWDAARKKYVGTWMDSMSSTLSTSEATFDAAAKRMNGSMEAPDMTGKVVKMRSTTDLKDGQRVFTMYSPGPDGKEVQVLRIIYTRHK
jgi:hypothetical protein